MKHLPSFSLMVLSVLAFNVQSEEVRVSCSKVADATERLACFDRTFPRESATAAPQVEVNQAQAESELSEIPVQSPVGTPERVEQEVSMQNNQAPVLGEGAMFSKKAKVALSSRLKSVRDQDKQKMVFLLENDQIWLQDSPRSLPFTKGEEVTIKSGTVGGYLLSNQTGLSTRVRRIK